MRNYQQVKVKTNRRCKDCNKLVAPNSDRCKACAKKRLKIDHPGKFGAKVYQ